MNLVLLAPFSLAILCACAPKNAPNPPASAPTPPVIQLAVTPAKFLADETNPGPSTATNSTLWEISIIHLPEGKINQLGLQAFFDLPRETNALMFEEISLSPVSELARRATNVNVTVQAGVHAAICAPTAASNLMANFGPHADVEITPPAKMNVPFKGQAQFFSGSTLTIVTGIKTNTSTVTTNWTTATTTNLSLGHTINLRSTQIGNDTILTAVSRLESFRGYAESNSGNPQQPTPKFEVTVFGTRTALRPNEVLLVGSPTITDLQRFSERVPRLSDIPFFGQLFVKSRTQTNRFRSLVLIRRQQE